MKMILILSTQRSGTNALRSALSSNDITLNLDEIFKREIPTIDNNIYNFFTKTNNIDKSLSLEEFKIEFVNYIKQLPKKDYYILDAKYNQLTPPYNYIVDFFIEKKFPIIHMIRKDDLQRLISLKVAERNGKFRFRINRDYSTLLKGKDYNINISKKELEVYSNSINKYITFYKSKLQDYKYYIEMDYDKSFTEQELTNYSKNLLKDIFSLELLQTAKISFIKTPVLPLINMVE